MTDKDSAVMIQKFNDFIDNTRTYRQAQEDIQKEISSSLKCTTRALFDKLNTMNDAILKLPCEGRKLVYQEKMKNVDGNIIALWTIVFGAVCAIVFEWFTKVSK